MSKSTLQDKLEVSWISSRKLKRNLREQDKDLKLAPGATLKSNYTNGLWIYPDYRSVAFRLVSDYQPAYKSNANGYHYHGWGHWGELSCSFTGDGRTIVHSKTGHWPSIEHFQWAVNTMHSLLPTARRLYGL